MEILLFKKTQDSDLEKEMKVCYKDLQENYSKLGVITDVIEIDGIKNYLINTSMGSYTADELRLIKE